MSYFLLIGHRIEKKLGKTRKWYTSQQQQQHQKEQQQQIQQQQGPFFQNFDKTQI